MQVRARQTDASTRNIALKSPSRRRCSSGNTTGTCKDDTSLYGLRRWNVACCGNCNVRQCSALFQNHVEHKAWPLWCNCSVPAELATVPWASMPRVYPDPDDPMLQVRFHSFGSTRKDFLTTNLAILSVSVVVEHHMRVLGLRGELDGVGAKGFAQPASTVAASRI